MKNILTPLILTFFLISCTSNLQKYEIQNAIEISVSTELELRGEGSAYNVIMDDIRDDYNPKHIIDIGKSKLIFQPKGTDAFKESAMDDVTRILITHFEIESNTFPKWNFQLNKQELNEANEYFEKETTKELKTLPFENDIIEWSPFKMGNVNGLSYIKGSYISSTEGDKSYNEMYQFFNKNEKVIIAFSTSISNKKKWDGIFNEMIKTFKFKLRK
ncbi:hypothetical protein [Bizionia arctica]|uniref:Lipoprotein n=1 Tax=Bizionia arctica TaxID=1495645 RepID=A0A917LRA6_9FLAO|nr:hypothetical protein [Bizionia arctica]GGG52034.1 hypothetical protein GCM10010976_23970 [Bizionia arctica]